MTPFPQWYLFQFAHICCTTSKRVKWHMLCHPSRYHLNRYLIRTTNTQSKEYHFLKDYFVSLGFPPIDDSAYPACGVLGFNKGCTQDRTLPSHLLIPYLILPSLTHPLSELIQGLRKSHPIAQPQTKPVYSNPAFVLAMYALTAQTGLDFPSLLATHLTTPLNMTSTFPSPGNDSRAVIPPVPHNWGSPYGDNAPAGGLVSTLSDLSVFLHAILTRSSSLSESKSRIDAWLHPRAFTGSEHTFVGSPWEIFRPPREVLFSSISNNNKTTTPPSADGDNNHGHTITLLSKDGAAYGYHSRITLVDSYGIGIVLLTAGDMDALTMILDAVYSLLIPAVDRAAREEVASLGYVGNFFSTSSNSTPNFNNNENQTRVNTKAEITQDEQSLKLTTLTTLTLATPHQNETQNQNKTTEKDILASLTEIWTATMASFLPGLIPTGEFRLYPAGISRSGFLAVSDTTTTTTTTNNNNNNNIIIDQNQDDQDQNQIQNGEEREREREKKREKKRAVIFEDWRFQWGVEWPYAEKSDLPGQGISSYDCGLWSLADWLHYGSEPVDRLVFVKDAVTGEVLGLNIPFLRTGVMGKKV